jgi:hypothetical protein
MNDLFPPDIALPIPLQILSHTPGRVRVRLTPDYRQPATMAAIAQVLQSLVNEIQQVKINPKIGSMTLYYDIEEGDLASFFAPLQELGLIVNAAPAAPTGKTAVAATVTGAMARLNQRVNQFTEGSVDLRSLVPLLLGLWAMRQFFGKSQSRMRIVPWYALAWYAFDTFMKLNASPADTSPTPQEQESGPLVSHHLAQKAKE